MDGPDTKSSRPDQAMILAAGFSTRLRPLTANLPKCMVPVGGQPLIAHTIEHLRSYGVVDIVINLHHAGARIVEYLEDGKGFGVRIRYSQEHTILGTAGGTRQAAHLFNGPFFVWYGDNLSTIRLDQFWAFHASVGAEATMALYRREDTSQSGVAEVDDNGRIQRFVEKPKPGEVSGAWVNAGVLALEVSALRGIPTTGVQDFGRQVIPDLVARDPGLYGYRMSSDEKLWWIDTPEDLRRVQANFGDMVIEESGRA